jgi:PDZ domain-containing protein
MRRRRQVFTGALIVLGIYAAAALPLPLYLVAPGAAIDLSSAVSVGSTAAPRDRFYLTDVRLMRASPLGLALALFPGVTLERSEAVLPSGVSDRRYEGVMQTAMAQSQFIAAVVAERAAGLAVPLPRSYVEVEAVDAASAAHGLLDVGDVIRSIDRRPVNGNADVRAVIATKPPDSALRVAIDRAGGSRIFTIRIVRLSGRMRLGVVLGERYGAVRLAVPVRYAIGDVGGSSGGLMMALRIYDGLRIPAPSAARSFAGTGTIALDGRIGPIEGTRQKLIAAKRAGARIFFVPRANYADVAGERDLRVIPIDTFGQARRELDGARGEPAPKPVGAKMPSSDHQTTHPVRRAQRAAALSAS